MPVLREVQGVARMSGRDELIDAGDAAVAALERGGRVRTRRQKVVAVVDAVEPIIRADERWERMERIIEAGRVAEAARRETRTDLRAKVEALNGILTAKFDEGQDVLLWRSEVIALLEEEPA